MSAGRVTLNHRSILVGDEEMLFYSGEMAPCRTPAEAWADVLSKMKAAGCTAVTFYIPWNWHELEEGQFDFEGRTHPQRNLFGFLDLVAQAGLYAVPRPGPFITFEWRHGGYPDWLLRRYPQILALNAAGKPTGLDVPYPPVSYLHPDFLDASRRWYEAVLPILARRQFSSGGPVIEMQLDDEPSYFQTLKGDPLAVDYNPVVVGDSHEPGFYQAWLEKRFGGDLARLNDTYRTEYAAFAEAQPPRLALQRAEELPRFLDWYACKLDVITEYAAHLYAWSRELGIEVPLAMLFPYLAQYYASDRLPRAFARRGLPVHITAECYPTGMSGVDHLAEDAIGHIIGNTEAYRTWWALGEGPPVSAEAQCSMAAHLEWHGLEMYYTLLLAHGLNGFNFFMMVGGETPRGYELFLGPTFDLSSPISPTGELRSSYWLLRRLGEWMQAHHHALARTEPVSAICYAYYPPYESAGYGIDTLAAGLRDDYRDALVSYFGIEGAALASLATLLPLSGADYALLNLEYADRAQLARHKQVWTAGLDFMSLAVQQKLADYVERGGHLVLLPRVPYLDEFIHPLDGPLAAIFPARPVDPHPGTSLGRYTPVQAVDVPSAGVDRAFVSDYIDTFELPAGAEALAIESATGRPCAYTVRYGAGRATLLGFKLRYLWDPQSSLKKLVNAVLNVGGVTRPAHTEGMELIASLRRGEGGDFLFVTNPSDVPQTAKIHYHDRDGMEKIFPRLIEGITFPRRGGLNLHLDAEIPNTGALLLYCTSQIQALQSAPGGFRLKLYAHPGVEGEAAFKLPSPPILAAVEGAPPLKQEWSAETGILTVIYRHPGELVELELAYQEGRP